MDSRKLGHAVDESGNLAPELLAKGVDGDTRVLNNVVQQAGGKYDVVENIATERGARTIALDEKTHRVYVPTATQGQAAANASPNQPTTSV